MKRIIEIFLLLIISLFILAGCSAAEHSSYANGSDFKKITVINIKTNEKIVEIIGNKSFFSFSDDKLEMSFYAVDGTRKVILKNSEYITYIIEDIDDIFDDFNHYECKYYDNNLQSVGE